MMSAESNPEKSVSYKKKDGRGHACPSFFWYDNDKDLKVCFLVTRAVYQGNAAGAWQNQIVEQKQKADGWTDIRTIATCVSPWGAYLNKS